MSLDLNGLSTEELNNLKAAIALAEKKIKDESRLNDLKTVKALCRLHGFTKTNLLGYLKTKGSSDKKKKAKA